jgi:hypothetical protein
MKDDASLSDAVSSITNPRIKYEIYKINADHILVSLGIFKNARGARPGSAALLEPGDACYRGRGTAYYELAQSYARQTFRRSTAVSDVLGKLSRGFERYLAVLSIMAGEYLNMVRAMSEGELYHLGHEVSRIGRDAERSALYDQFLDAYSSYRKRKSARSRSALQAAVRRLQLTDPSFRFELEG